MRARGGARRHRLLLELGRGGMGVVYVAKRVATDGEIVVVKRLRADLATEAEFRRMFMDEARIATRIAHPNVVQTFDVGFDGRLFYLEMEFLDGQSLDAVLRRAGSAMPLSLMLYALCEVLAGLHAAHELRDPDGAPLGVVHRDVSPHNVFVTYAGDVKLLDFGIAKAADSSGQTRTGVVKGKATYMAPEQATRDAVDRRTDVFAVGVVLWQALTGARLWGDKNEQEIFEALRLGIVASPRAQNPDVSLALEAICMRALARRREDRWTTADDLRVALDAYRRTLPDVGDGGALAVFVATRFAEDRAWLTEEIAALVADESADEPDDADVPVVGGSRTRTLEKPSTDGRAPEAPAASVVTAPRRTRAVFAIGVAIAVAVGVAALVVRARSPAHDTISAGHASSATPPRCTSSRACSDAAAAPSLCRATDGACVALASIDCEVRADRRAIESDDTLWIGTMFPETGSDAQAYGTASARAVDLARRDFMDVAGGLPYGRADGAARPIGIVACNDAVDATRAARHLVDDVRVPAVIGFHTSQEIVDLATSTFVPAGVLAVASLNTGPHVTGVLHPPGSPRLVWRTTISTAQVTPPLAAFVGAHVEPALRATGAVEARAPMRVGVVRANHPTSRALVDALVEQLRFNDKTVSANGAAFRDFAYAGGDPPDVASVVAGLAEFRPHVIVVLAPDLTTSVVAPLEARWPASARHRPTWVMGGPWEGEAFQAFVGTSAEKRRRFFGLTPPSSTPANSKFTIRYNETFSPKVTTTTSPASPYDSFYLLAYAAFIVGDAPITGVSLARAFERLVPPGRPIDVGSTGIFDAFSALRAGDRVDLRGAFSSLDFDLATGEARSSFAVLCVAPGADGGASDDLESGLVFDATSGRLEGRMRCP